MVRRGTERDRDEARRAALLALTDYDRAYVLGYLRFTVPGAVDLALAALAASHFKGLRTQDPV
jgi:hypothetical protein